MGKRKSMDSATAGLKRKSDEVAATPATKRVRQAESTRSNGFLDTPRTGQAPASAMTDRSFVTAQSEMTPSRDQSLIAQGSSDEDNEETPKKLSTLGLKASKGKVSTQPTPSKASKVDTKPKLSTTNALTKSEKKAEKKANKKSKSQAELKPVLPTKEELEEIEVRRQQRKAEKKARREAAKDSSALVHIEQVEKTATNPDWSLSAASAGRFIDQDPTFVQDQEGESFLVAATDIAVEVLSLETSLTVRSLTAPAGTTVRCVSVSKSRPDTLYIGYSNGSIHYWTWATDLSEAKALLTVDGNCKALDAVQVAEGQSDSAFYLTQHGEENKIFGNGKELYATKSVLDQMQVLREGSYVVAFGRDTLLLGGRKFSDSAELDYVWLEIPMTVPITCVGARMAASVGVKKDQKRLPELSLAVGTNEGQIELFEHGLSGLLFRKGDRSLPTPRTLHWHREAASSVKFSQDGNYLISGGRETVLVLWQLSTGHKQFLPHLTSAVERVVVSPQGDRYAVQMGDNSIMVLSTSELKPVANFARLQLSCPVSSGKLAVEATPAVLNPRNVNELLLAVPASRPQKPNTFEARPFLQSFDIRNSRHITRQALGRNNITDFNLGPEKTPIIPPDVILVQISPDGMWLATVDEWLPPVSDMGHLSSASESQMEFERQKRREVHLKIWNWNSVQNIWTLTTRIDGPHGQAGGNLQGAGKVLALAADPSASGFATIGEDNTVRVWKPKTRMRHGVAMTDDENNELIEWTCKHATPLLSNAIPRADALLIANEAVSLDSIASLAYSEDGSLIAAAVNNLTSEGNGSVVHIVDSAGGDPIANPNVATAGVVALGFVDRYLVAVSRKAARVWDMIDNRLHIRIRLHNSDDDLPLLAVNHATGTFAIALGDRVSIYGPKRSKATCKVETGATLAAILANEQGYTLLSTDLTTRFLARSTLSQRLAQATISTGEDLAEVPAAQSMEVDDDMEFDDDQDTSEVRQRLALPGDTEDDRPVVRPEQLAGIFELNQSFAMPPVRDMFQSIAELFGRRPHSKVGTEVMVA